MKITLRNCDFYWNTYHFCLDKDKLNIEISDGTYITTDINHIYDNDLDLQQPLMENIINDEYDICNDDLKH